MPVLRPAALALAVLAALPGCSLLQTPQLLLLPPPPAPEAAVEGLESEVILVPSVLLPSYAADTAIAIVSTDPLSDAPPSGLVLSPADGLAWADDPERAVTIALANALAERTGAPALAEPWPVETIGTIKTEVQVNRLAGRPGGPLELTGEYRISDLRLNGLAVVRAFALEVTVEDAGAPALARAYAAVIAALADDMTAAIAERFGGEAG